MYMSSKPHVCIRRMDMDPKVFTSLELNIQDTTDILHNIDFLVQQ